MKYEVIVDGVMYSYRKHGHWVRLKGSNREGRISFYEKPTKKVWVVWEVKDYIISGYTHKVKYPVASGHYANELVYLPREPYPWIDINKVAEAYSHRKGT